MRKITKRSAAIAAAAVIGIGAAGVAAAWGITGSGEASGTATAALPIKADFVVVGQLYPGASLPAKVTVTNPNKFDVSVTGLAATGFEITGGNGCTAANSGVSLNPAALPKLIQGDATNVEFQVADVVRMAKNAADGCQNATFRLTYNLSGTSA